MRALTAAAIAGLLSVPTAAAADYEIGREDVLQIDVLRYAELSGPAVVRPDGRISAKLVGDVTAAGRTAVQVAEEIRKRLVPFVPDAHVTVTVSEINSLRVYVLGRVTAPGMFKVGSPPTVLQALAMAKGFTPWAKRSRLVLVRGATGTRVRVDFDRLVAGEAEDFTLDTGDTLVVP